MDAANLDEEQQIILRAEFEQNLILELKTTRDGAVKDVIQLLYNKGWFDSFKKLCFSSLCFVYDFYR